MQDQCQYIEVQVALHRKSFTTTCHISKPQFTQLNIYRILVTTGSRILVTTGSRILVTTGSRILVTTGSRILVTTGSRILVTTGSRILVTTGSRILVTIYTGSRILVTTGSCTVSIALCNGRVVPCIIVNKKFLQIKKGI